MDDKTEELRDIFMDVADDGTVTERQAESRGSLTDVDEADIQRRLGEVVAEMRERYAFETDLDTERYCDVVRGFYEGERDDALAERLEVDEATVFAARMDLHLVDDADTEAPVDVARLRELLAAGETETDALAERLEADTATVARYRRVAAAQNAARQASYRYRTAFEDALVDAGLSVQHTAAVREDGLDDATEDIETNVSF